MNKQLAEIEARLNAVTPGEWKAYNRGIGYEVHSEYDEPINIGCRETFRKEDAEFIAAAPTTVARLTAALDAVLELTNAVTLFENALGRDLSDEDFDRGWHGARRDVAAQIRAVIETELKESK